jgi:asparagine synthase (glutamine-hydrolysing)
MCGIAGIAGAPRLDPEREAVVRAMAATLVHRGPDGEGHAHRRGCDLGFRRLAIIDSTGPGAPHASEDGTVWSICNGEIYNYAELRARLAARGHRFSTGNDTEVLPHLYEEHGDALVDHLDGMFAFALFDERRQRLLLGRDRAGEKPLFYWQEGGEIAFGSELRALVAHPRLALALDPVALSRYLLHDFFPAPATPLGGVRKLPAGHLLVAEGGAVRVRRYWDLADYAAAPGPGTLSLAAAAARLDELLAQAVRRRKASDLPVGVFLSGGLDSSAVLAHLSAQEGPGVPVFSLGQTDRGFDESSFARRTAERFGAEYHELVVGEEELADGLGRIGRGFDEPLGDASTIPTHLLSLLARRRVKVVLSGEGGDELFGGYPTYLGHRLVEWYRRVPRPLRRAAVALLLKATPVSMGNVGFDYLLRRFQDGAELPPLERHSRWFGSVPADLQGRLLAPRVRAAVGEEDPLGAARAALAGKRFADDLAALLYVDFSLYLQDDLLTKVDRATMLASLESRAPFLDHELAQFAAALPSRLKVRGLTTKAVLRRALAHRLPREVLTRRKRGFNIPFSRWVLHGLGPELERRFSRERVEARGLLDHAAVARLLAEHRSRRADHRKPLFTLLALDLWCDRTFGDGAAVPLAAAPAAPVDAVPAAPLPMEAAALEVREAAS